MVPGLLVDEQKEIRINICADILQNIENDPNVLTRDESGFFQYDPESKRQSMRWKSHSSPRQKKTQHIKSKFKAIMIFSFFDFRGIVHVDWVPESQTVDQVYYKEVLTDLRERVRRRKRRRRRRRRRRRKRRRKRRRRRRRRRRPEM